MLIALMAAGAMLLTDVLGTILVQAEAANRGWLAGLCDCLGWYVGIATTTISVTTLSGHDTGEKVLVLILVGGANILGTKLGQVSGKWLLHRFPVHQSAADERLDGLEARLRYLEERERGMTRLLGVLRDRQR